MTMIMIDKAVVEQALEALAIGGNIALVGSAYTPKSIDAGVAKMRTAMEVLREAQQPQQPLSEEEIQQLKLDCGYDYYASYEVSAAFIHGVKECEAAHGITKENA